MEINASFIKSQRPFMVKKHYLQTQSRLPRMLSRVSSQMCWGGGRGVFKDNECKDMSNGLSQDVTVITNQQQSFKCDFTFPHVI